ncbi:MAG: alpha/beta hydrolase, partial [Actinobacteria bacterium]|nr:alpha/beta hydrolase [Actinomycetota bacterium]
FLDPLAERGWHAVAADLRGHGDSDHPADVAAYSLEIFVDEILGLVDSLDWAYFVVMAHSMGGAVAQRLALDNPGRVRALVLMNTFHGPVAIDRALIELAISVVRQGGMPALAAAQAARREADPAAAAAHRRIEQARPGFAERLNRKLLACSQDMWLAMAPRFPDWPDTLSEVGSLSIPTLVIVGEDDATMRADCERLAAAIPGARLEVLAGTRHAPHLEAPDSWWGPVAAFLEGLVDGAGPTMLSAASPTQGGVPAPPSSRAWGPNPTPGRRRGGG